MNERHFGALARMAVRTRHFLPERIAMQPCDDSPAQGARSPSGQPVSHPPVRSWQEVLAPEATIPTIPLRLRPRTHAIQLPAGAS